MRKSTLAILLGATGTILGLKALYKAYKLDYELSENEDEGLDEGLDEGSEKADEPINVCVRRVFVPIQFPQAKSKEQCNTSNVKKDTQSSKPNAKPPSEPIKTDETADNKKVRNQNCKARVKAWRAKNPKGRQCDCIKKTGISESTVKKYWKECEPNNK